MPDLQAAQATNGKQGYIFTKDIFAMDHDGYINVYESDGTTVIGKFAFGNVDKWGDYRHPGRTCRWCRQVTEPSPDAITLEATRSIDVTWALGASSGENGVAS